MGQTTAGVVQASLVIAVLAAAHRPLGDWMARVYTSPHHTRLERVLYRLSGVDPRSDQRWTVYALSLLAFSAVGVLLLYGLQRLQHLLPLSSGRGPVPADIAWNTAVSFVTNTNWQAYSGESTMGHLVQLLGLTVQNFVSAAVGMAVAVALVRALTRSGTDRIGNFLVDLVRGTLRILVPLAAIAAVLLLAGGVIQNLHVFREVSTLTGGTQSIPGGPVASQEAIKELGTNGGGFFNANSAHPFENPNPVTNALQVVLLLLIPSAMPRMLGTMLGRRAQGYAVLAVMGLLWVSSLALVTWAEVVGNGTVPHAVGASMEGKEQRFGIWASTLFAASTTGTSTGAVNSFHDSYTGLGGGTLLANMMLGEVSPGGVGSGLYGMLVVAVLTVFLAGLMVGRTPEFLGRRVGGHEITMVALYLLAMPATLLVGLATAVSLPVARASLQEAGAHGLSEAMYAFASAANNNGSCFCGLSAATPFWDVTLGLAMLIGRFVPIVLVLALAGAFARRTPVPSGPGTLPTDRPLFVVLLLVVVVVVAGLTFVPALALGPIAEGLL